MMTRRCGVRRDEVRPIAAGREIAMDEQELRKLIAAVKTGRISRRALLQRVVGLGLAAPLATQLLARAGLAQPVPATQYKPAKAGGGGALKTLFWQAPTALNPHFSVGAKDSEGCRIFYEPLAAWDPGGNLAPVLAAEIPDIENGGVAPDGKSVTWKLKKGVRWHDGAPFTADDVVFESYKGANSREAPANLKPVGTGPYVCVDFKPGDWVKGERNPSYHVPNRPYFDTIEMKGGGDAVSAARAVVQTGEYDYAWNVQVEDEILVRLEDGGKGKVDIVAGGDIEHIQCNFTDPWKEVDGERSSIKTKHPFLSDPAVRQALSLLVDRASVQEQIYGRTGISTANYLNAPARYQSKSTKWEFNVDKANQVLDAAGWKRGSDGIREKGGVKLKMVYQTSINASRQKTQQVVKQAASKAGIDIDIKSVTASVYFSSDPANLDTYPHFSTDIQMYTTTMTQPDPELFMIAFTSWEVASKENKWQGRNITRWKSEEYDKLYKASEGELDPAKRAALFIKMNDLAIQNGVVIPVVWRPRVRAISNKLKLEQSGWDSDFWNLQHWYREA